MMLGKNSVSLLLLNLTEAFNPVQKLKTRGNSIEVKFKNQAKIAISWNCCSYLLNVGVQLGVELEAFRRFLQEVVVCVEGRNEGSDQLGSGVDQFGHNPASTRISGSKQR
jgi:hypothetical protein